MSVQCEVESYPTGGRRRCQREAGHDGAHDFSLPMDHDLDGWGNGAIVANGEWKYALPKGPVARLISWWLNTALNDVLETMPKVEEYGGSTGSADLELLGDNIAKMMGWEDVDTAVLQELGCWFYAQGKLARLVSDYQQHRPGKPDTLKDANVYVMMMRRLQEVGGWPG